jgi:Domain of unknown function (DUF4278)
MQLQYRGAKYDYNPTPVAVTDSETVGQYRGSIMRFHNFKLPKLFHPTFELVYRGVHFHSAI